MDSILKAFDYKENSVRLIAAGLITIFVVVSWLGVFDNLSEEYIDSALIQTVVAFGVARGLNALVSVLQSTEISFQLGAGVAVGIGEVLDPMNDLVEQYSTLMKLSIGSLVIQKLLIEIVSDTIFKILITVSGIALVFSFFYKQARYVNVFAKLFVFLFFVRFLLVFIVLLNGAVDKAFIQDKIEKEIVIVEGIASEIEMTVNPSTLSAEEQELLNSELTMLSSEVTNLTTINERITSEISELMVRVAEIDAEIAEVRAAQGIQRFNVFSNDEMIEKLRAERNEHKASIDELESSVSDNLKSIEESNNRIVYVNNVLEGKPNSVGESLSQRMNAMRDRVTNITSNVDVTSIKAKLEDAVSNIVNIMTLFVFKTVILPLFFLFLGLKGTRLIWGVDLMPLLNPKK